MKTKVMILIVVMLLVVPVSAQVKLPVSVDAGYIMEDGKAGAAAYGISFQGPSIPYISSVAEATEAKFLYSSKFTDESSETKAVRVYAENVAPIWQGLTATFGAGFWIDLNEGDDTMNDAYQLDIRYKVGSFKVFGGVETAEMARKPNPVYIRFGLSMVL